MPAISGRGARHGDGSGGGVIRNVLSAEIPFVLRRGNLYASTVIVGRLGVPRARSTRGRRRADGVARRHGADRARLAAGGMAHSL